MTNKEMKHLLKLMIDKERQTNKDRENSHNLQREFEQSETASQDTIKRQNKN